LKRPRLLFVRPLIATPPATPATAAPPTIRGVFILPTAVVTALPAAFVPALAASLAAIAGAPCTRLADGVLPRALVLADELLADERVELARPVLVPAALVFLELDDDALPFDVDAFPFDAFPFDFAFELDELRRELALAFLVPWATWTPSSAFRCPSYASCVQVAYPRSLAGKPGGRSHA
jgi:hypothetical protein